MAGELGRLSGVHQLGAPARDELDVHGRAVIEADPERDRAPPRHRRHGARELNAGKRSELDITPGRSTRAEKDGQDDEREPHFASHSTVRGIQSLGRAEASKPWTSSTRSGTRRWRGCGGSPRPEARTSSSRSKAPTPPAARRTGWRGR